MEKKYFSVVFRFNFDFPVVAGQEKKVTLDTSEKMECSNTLVLIIMEEVAHNLCRSIRRLHVQKGGLRPRVRQSMF